MKPALLWLATGLLFGPGFAIAGNARAADAWIPLFDGKGLSGWKAGEHPGSITVRDGMIVCDRPRAYLFYVGDIENADFRNFELKATVKTTPGACSGILFHTQYQASGFPSQGYQAEINNTDPGSNNAELRKTGSLCGVRNLYKSIAEDNQWFDIHVAVTGKRIRIAVNEIPVVDYTEPAGAKRNSRRGPRFPSHGTFALECHGGHGKVYYRSILVRPLPDEPAASPAEGSVPDDRDVQILNLHRNAFPLVDFHVHLKGGLTLEEALENSRRTGINYGIAPNCGLGFPITDDQGIYRFLEGMKGQPVFVGMQAEGREWVRLFSKEAIGRFDYVFSDAMTFTDDKGKRIRLWIKEEVEIDDEQAFMDMCVDRVLSVLNNEPIDVYVNPTFLPEAIADRYDMLWTGQRMQKVIDAAVKNDVAIEINARYRLPSPAFIKRAKRAGVKFSLGTNNGGRDLGKLDYCLEMIRQCGLRAEDMFMPKPRRKAKQ